MLVIGFAEEYYTLWDMVSHLNHYQAPSGQVYPSYETRHYTYLKNISKDLDKAKKKYPDLEIDKYLRGRRNSFSLEVRENDLSPEMLKSGKYAGWDVRELIQVDLGYCIWLVGSSWNKKTVDIVKETQGYKDYMFQLEVEKEQKIKNQVVYDSGEYIFNIERNVDANGRIGLYGNHQVLFLNFHKVKSFIYNNSPYYLPVFNGKAKRIKNKNILYKIEIITTVRNEKTGELMQEANVLSMKSLRKKI